MSSKKIYVLDTNVLIYDPLSIFKFKEHDIYLPIVAIEELDNNKKGISDVARAARQSTRILNEIIEKNINDGLKIGDGLRLDYNIEANLGLKTKVTGKLFIQADDSYNKVVLPIPNHKADNDILKVAVHIKKTCADGCEVVLISKDINLRIKANILGVKSEDYESDTLIEDSSYLYQGYSVIDRDVKSHFVVDSEFNGNLKKTVLHIDSMKTKNYFNNEFMVGTDGVFQLKNKNGDLADLIEIKNYKNNKNQVWGINAKNEEQNYALNLLLDHDIDLVTILGQAGSGKTIITLAACLKMIFEDKKYEEVIYTRATIPVGDDIGFLPGTEEEKMTPWAGALYDNLEVLAVSPSEGGNWGKSATKDVVMSKIKIKSINFMRGRTFVNKILIIDEAQNMTPKQIKTLVTRCGEGTKLICLGNLAQIDAPYLTEINCGLTYLVERMKGWNNYGHLTLAKVERSRLSDYAASVL